LNSILINNFLCLVPRDILYKFIRTYLLEANQAQVRWTLHSLLFSLYKNASQSLQEYLYDILIQMWPEAMFLYGQKACQYTDLIGFIVVKSNWSPIRNDKSKGSDPLPESHRLKDLLDRTIDLFKQQNLSLATHPNSSIYNTLLSLFPDIGGLYLESDPCFICNNIETPISNFKLNSIKADSRFTTNQQLFKLSSSHSISKMIVKISEIRKNKMVSVMNIFYTNKSVQSIVDLKMNSKLWVKAKRVHVQPGQQEVRIEFQLPIVACSLMIEYADFYERDAQSSTETTMLQCPRCSASVPAHPGVCTTCGENVFQCHKCRSINYDERDPFICTSCGFCKFAKFEFTLIGRSCIAVDTIQSEDDRTQTVQSISNLLDRADKIYSSISQQIRPTLEALIIKLNEQNVLDKFMLQSAPVSLPLITGDTDQQQQQQAITSFLNNNILAGLMPQGTLAKNAAALNQTASTAAAATTAANVQQQQQSGMNTSIYSNKIIQSVQQKYTIECKNKFDELCKIVLKLYLLRKELRDYDKQFKAAGEANQLINIRKNSTTNNNDNKAFNYYNQILNRQMSQLKLTSKSRHTGQSSTTNQSMICYGCMSASITNCLTIFRAVLCGFSNPAQIAYVKNELCKHNILEELINFNLKRNVWVNQRDIGPIIPQAIPPSTTTTTAPPAIPATPSNNNIIQNQQRLYDHDLVNIIFVLIKENVTGTQRFHSLFMQKIDALLNKIPTNITNNDETAVSCLNMISTLHQLNGASVISSSLKHEFTLLTALMQRPDVDELCWEMRIRLLLHIILTSLNAVTLNKNKEENDYSFNKYQNNEKGKILNF
jgi:E3 ubiquitin-protein ligase UBR4